MVSLWVHMLSLVNYEDKPWKGIVIKRGQLVTSLPSLSALTGLSIQEVRTCLKRLETTGEISQKSTNKFRIITICKYCSYQPTEEDFQQTTNRQLTGKQQASNSQTTATKEYKEDKNIKKRTTNVVPKEKFIAPEFEEAFNLWLEYKRQRRESYKSKMSLQACYNKLLKLSDGNPFTAMLIVQQSMANNWAGLFELKENKNGGSENNNDHNARLVNDGVRAIQALAAEGGTPKEVPF